MNVPKKVSDVLAGLYPNAKDIMWDWAVPAKVYKAIFEHGEQALEVEITGTGHHLCTNKEMDIDDVPQRVTQAIEEEFEGYSLEMVDEVTFSDGKKLYSLGFAVGDGFDDDFEDGLNEDNDNEDLEDFDDDDDEENKKLKTIPAAKNDGTSKETTQTSASKSSTKEEEATLEAYEDEDSLDEEEDEDEEEIYGEYFEVFMTPEGEVLTLDML